MYPLLGDRQYLLDEKIFGDMFFLLFISTYLTHSGQISWLYHYNYDRFSYGGAHKMIILRSKHCTSGK